MARIVGLRQPGKVPQLIAEVNLGNKPLEIQLIPEKA
jgi:hypothetical protein